VSLEAVLKERVPPCSVLVADDDARLRAIILEFLQQEGYATQGAADGRAALSCLEQEPFDVVVLDIHLPRMDGWEVARAIRERGLRSKIVVLTAAHDARAAAERMGANGYVAKPFALLQLSRALEHSLTEP